MTTSITSKAPINPGHDLQKVIREIEYLRNTSCQAYQGKPEKLHEDTLIDASDYVAYRLCLSHLDRIIRNPTQDALKLLQLFGTVVTALQNQIEIIDSDGELEGCLITTGVSSFDFEGTDSSDVNCLFTVGAFDLELKACGVRMPNTDMILDSKEEIYQRFLTLPPAVKSMFFAVDDARSDEEPFSMIRDILDFADEATWNVLKNQAHLDSKADFNRTLNAFVIDFIQSEISKHQLKLGITSTRVDDNGNMVKASNKAQAIAQFCKPRKWIAKQKYEKKGSSELRS